MKNRYEVFLDYIVDNLIGFTLKYKGRERYYPIYLSNKPFTDKIYTNEEFILEKIDELIERNN